MTTIAPAPRPTGITGFVQQHEALMVGGGFATTLGGIYGAVSLVDKSRFLGAVGTGVALLGVASMITAAVVGLPGDRSTPSLSENGKYELAKAATTANVSYAAAHATLDQVYQLDRAGKNQLSFNGAFDLSKAAVLGHVSASDAIDTLNQVNQLDHAGKDQLSAIGVLDLSRAAVQGRVSASTAIDTLYQVEDLNDAHHLNLSSHGVFDMTTNAVRAHTTAAAAVKGYEDASNG